MKNRRIRISQSQLGRLVENNVNENTGGVGNLSTDDSPNIGMGSSKLVTKTHMNKPAGRLNIMGGTNPKEFKRGGRKEPQGMSYKKEMTGEHKSSERLGGENLVVIWPSRQAQQEMSGRLDQMGLELPDGWEPGMVCALCACPPGSGMALWINGCPCEEEEFDPMEWMNENSHTIAHSDQQDLFGEDRIEEDLVQAWDGSPNHHCVCVYCCTNGDYTHEYNEGPCDCSMGGDCCSSTGMEGGELVGVETIKLHHDMDKKKTKAGCESDGDCEEGECCYTAQCLACKDVPGESVSHRVRRSDRDKARRRPYSPKARDMRGSRNS